MHTSSRRILLALIAGAHVAAPSPASAQLGRIHQEKVGDKVADRVAGKVLGEDAGSAKAPKFSATVLEISGERIDQVLRGLDAETSAGTPRWRRSGLMRQRVTAYDRAVSETGDVPPARLGGLQCVGW